MKKNFYILLILLSGAFLFPEAISACEKMPEESAEACKMDNAQDSEKTTSCDRDCCKKDNAKATSEQPHECDKDCNCQGNCHQVLTHFNFALSTITADLSCKVDFFPRKDNFYSSKTQPTSGFCSIWIPPNINS